MSRRTAGGPVRGEPDRGDWSAVMTCDAFHDGHDCTLPGACTTALAALLARCEDRRRTEHDEQLAELERRKVRAA